MREENKRGAGPAKENFRRDDRTVTADRTVLRDVSLRFNAAGDLEQMWAVLPVPRHSRAARAMAALAYQLRSIDRGLPQVLTEIAVLPAPTAAPDGTATVEVDVYAAESDDADDCLVSVWSLKSDGATLTLTNIDSM